MKILSKTTTIRLSPKVHQRLFQIAAEIEQHPSAIIRSAIYDYISKREAERHISTNSTKAADLQK